MVFSCALFSIDHEASNPFRFLGAEFFASYAFIFIFIILILTAENQKTQPQQNIRNKQRKEALEIINFTKDRKRHTNKRL